MDDVPLMYIPGGSKTCMKVRVTVTLLILVVVGVLFVETSGSKQTGSKIKTSSAVVPKLSNHGAHCKNHTAKGKVGVKESSLCIPVVIGVLLMAIFLTVFFANLVCCYFNLYNRLFGGSVIKRWLFRYRHTHTIVVDPEMPVGRFSKADESTNACQIFEIDQDQDKALVPVNNVDVSTNVCEIEIDQDQDKALVPVNNVDVSTNVCEIEIDQEQDQALVPVYNVDVSTNVCEIEIDQEQDQALVPVNNADVSTNVCEIEIDQEQDQALVPVNNADVSTNVCEIEIDQEQDQALVPVNNADVSTNVCEIEIDQEQDQALVPVNNADEPTKVCSEDQQLDQVLADEPKLVRKISEEDKKLKKALEKLNMSLEDLENCPAVAA